MSSSANRPPAIEAFSKLELDVLTLRASGASLGEIGIRYSLSEHAIFAVISSAVYKLEAKNEIHAVSMSIKLGLID